jgi:hypothetical protein
MMDPYSRNHATPPSQVMDINRSNSRSASYVFPEDLGAIRMVMSFTPYSYSSTFGFANVSGGTKTVYLPIPPSLSDDTAIDSNQAQLGVTGALALQTMQTIGSGGVDAFAEGAYNIAKDVVSASGEALGFGGNPEIQASLENYKLYAKLLGRSALDSIVPGAGLAADLYTGSAVNPYTTVDFSGVRLKFHNFVWTVSPKSQEESNTIRDIIKVIKGAMLPEYGGTSAIAQTKALLKYPNLVNIKFLGINDEYYYKFKPSMIQSFNVRFNEGNQLHLFEGGKPVVLTLQLNLLEASIHTSEDYR